MRQGWEGRDQRERCAARQRSEPLDSLAPARSRAEGRGAAQLKNLTVSGFETGVDSIVHDTGQKC